MAATTAKSPPLIFFFLHLLSLALLSAKVQQRQIEGCPSFSCGQLRNISYPFRQRDDPPQCGEVRYQLNCQDNKSTISIGSVEYLVTNIQYDSFSDDWMPGLVDPNFVGGGSCALPSQTLSIETLYRLGYWQYFWRWAIFMNCSQPIANDGSNYWPLSCLNSRYNSSFVYAFIAYDGHESRNFPPPCEIISRIPVIDDSDPPMIHNSTAYFFSILQKGFPLGLLHQRPNKSCLPFSCGQLQNISYPFRRADDPPHCGEARYQVNCLGNKSTIFIRSVDYPVTEIQQDYYLQGQDYYLQGQNLWRSRAYVHLVDPNFIGGGSCRLPSQSLSPDDIPYNSEEWWNLGSWASFMNCSKPIQNDSRFWPVSCLNSRYSTSFVYVFVDGYELQYLPPSCQFISMIPMAHYYYPWMIQNSTPDIFRILQEGFILSFDKTTTKIKFLDCLKEYRLSAIGLIEFEYCLQRYFNHTVPYNIITIVLVFIHTLAIFIVLLIVTRLVAAPIIIWLLVIYKAWSIKRQEAIDTVEKFLRHQQILIPTRYAYTDIIAITRHFKEKIGQGGFGLVFKGELAGGILVAVKMMGSSKCNGDEFINEVSTIGRIHHVNVVRLVGYCSDGSKRALIYEYMPNGSLDKYIFSNKDGTNLHTFTSEKLIDIAMGIARGINYLHRGCDMQILHFDIKPHNILLDRNFTPKISDFGLARLYPKDNSLVSISATRGTIGYIAPELISRSFGVITQKSDVYSYGMLLMEMAGRRRNVDPLIGNSSQVYYPSWIYDKLNLQQEIILENNFEISELEKKLAKVGLWCIQMKSFERPIMSKVIEMLELDVEAIPMPPKPFFSSMESILENKMHLDSISTELSVISE